MCSAADDPTQHEPLSAVDALRELAYDLVNDHRGIPYDVVERIDAVLATLVADGEGEQVDD